MIVAPLDFRDEELLEPRVRFEAEGAAVEVASSMPGVAHGELGAAVQTDLTLAVADPGRYRALVVVGGDGARHHLWHNGDLHALLRRARAAGVTVGGICLGAVVLARAGLLRGVRATAYGEPHVRDDLTARGAIWVEDDVVTDRGIVTADGSHTAAAFADAVVAAVRAAVPAASPGPHRRAR